MIGNFELKLNEYILFQYNFGYDTFFRTIVCFSTPSIHLFTYKRDMWLEWQREIGIRCPTTFIFSKSEFFWSFTAVLLGFGIGFSHQSGY